MDLEIEWEGIDWIVMVQDRNKWRDVATAVMKLCFYKL
jgi:hypothetical protein